MEPDEPTRCICDEEHNTQEDGFMISCEKCFFWFHGDCVGIYEQNEPESWTCPRCQTGDTVVDVARMRSKPTVSRSNSVYEMVQNPLAPHQFRFEDFSLEGIDMTSVEGKKEYARRMRLAFTNKEMIEENGTLRPDFFKARKKKKRTEKWGEAQLNALYEGLELFGVGNWKEIKDRFQQVLSHLEANDLRVKCCTLVGRQNLQEYKGQKMTRDLIREEKSKNEKIGKEKGCWKNGMLVADDEGKRNNRDSTNIPRLEKKQKNESDLE